jgi:hypothetical protein
MTAEQAQHNADVLAEQETARLIELTGGQQ